MAKLELFGQLLSEMYARTMETAQSCRSDPVPPESSLWTLPAILASLASWHPGHPSDRPPGCLGSTLGNPRIDPQTTLRTPPEPSRNPPDPSEPHLQDPPGTPGPPSGPPSGPLRTPPGPHPTTLDLSDHLVDHARVRRRHRRRRPLLVTLRPASSFGADAVSTSLPA